MKTQITISMKKQNNKKGFLPKYWWIFPLAIIIIIAMYFLFASAIFEDKPDSFGKKHPIPEGMEYSIPLNEGEVAEEPSNDSLSMDKYLQVWNGIQGGVYQYRFYYPALPDGEVFLRCYEATDSIGLSASRLRDASAVEVKDHTEFGLIADMQQFVIYEGDWDDYYAARIEVWHKDANTEEETKLLEKIYRVEGWMR